MNVHPTQAQCINRRQNENTKLNRYIELVWMGQEHHPAPGQRDERVVIVAAMLLLFEPLNARLNRRPAHA